MEVSYVPEPERHPLWPAMLELLEPAAEIGGIDAWEPGDLVWIAYDGPVLFGVATTRLLPGDEAELRLVGGARLRRWVGLADEVVGQWARDCGAYRLTARGRDGWARYAPRLGWVALGKDDEGRMLFEKEL